MYEFNQTCLVGTGQQGGTAFFFQSRTDCLNLLCWQILCSLFSWFISSSHPSSKMPRGISHTHGIPVSGSSRVWHWFVCVKLKIKDGLGIDWVLTQTSLAQEQLKPETFLLFPVKLCVSHARESFPYYFRSCISPEQEM